MSVCRLRFDLRGQEFGADLALRRDVTRGPDELLPGGQPGDVVGVDGDELGGVDPEMNRVPRGGVDRTGFSRVPLQGEAPMRQ